LRLSSFKRASGIYKKNLRSQTRVFQKAKRQLQQYLESRVSVCYRVMRRAVVCAMRYTIAVESIWLIFYFGIYLSILMGAYWFLSFVSSCLTLQVFELWVFLIAFFSFLLVSTVHEIGHYVALRLKGYSVLSISVWSYLIPVGVRHLKWRSREDKILLCLSGPFAGVLASLLLGYILFLSVPTVLPLIAVMILSAVAL